MVAEIWCPENCQKLKKICETTRSGPFSQIRSHLSNQSSYFSVHTLTSRYLTTACCNLLSGNLNFTFVHTRCAAVALNYNIIHMECKWQIYIYIYTIKNPHFNSLGLLTLTQIAQVQLQIVKCVTLAQIAKVQLQIVKGVVCWLVESPFAEVGQACETT